MKIPSFLNLSGFLWGLLLLSIGSAAYLRLITTDFAWGLLLGLVLGAWGGLVYLLNHAPAESEVPAQAESGVPGESPGPDGSKNSVS